MLNFKPLFALIKKEFISVWQDKKTRSVIFLPPILQLFIFSYAATLDIQNIKIGVLDCDNTEISREFTRQIKASKYFTKVYHFKNNNELKSAIDEEKIKVGVYINNDFTRKFKKKNSPEILIVTDGRHTNGSQIISSYVSEIANNFTPFGQVKKPNLINFELRNNFNLNLSYHWFIISSLVGILPMTTVILLSSLSLAREKEEGTFDELLIVPLKISEIIFAKVAVPVFFGLLNGCIVLFLSILFFNLPFFGSFFLYIFSLFCFLLSIVGVGLFISSICKTQQQAMVFVFIFMFPAMMLSGYTTPIENISPPFLQHLTVLNPLRFFLVISKGIILKNMNLYYVLLNLLPIVMVSILTLYGSMTAFQRKIE